MDMDYIFGREQISLHNALVAASPSARIAHEGLAKAYAALLAKGTIPPRHVITATAKRSVIRGADARSDGVLRSYAAPAGKVLEASNDRRNDHMVSNDLR